ncbi:MAG: type II secretion system secretin GspD [Bdellovibrionales bacterium]
MEGLNPMNNMQPHRLWLVGLFLFCLAMPTHELSAQPIPPEDFLNEDDFDAPPPGTFIPSEPPPPGTMDNPPPQDPPSTFNPPSSNDSSGPSRAGSPRKRRPISEASSDEITNENYPDLIDSFDYPNAEITDVIKAMSELTGKNFIVDPGVRGKITIIAPSKITVAEAYKAFLSALAINGFSVVPSGKFMKVKPARDAQKDSIETYSGAYSPDTDQMITRIVHLKHISAADVNTKLRNLSSKFGDISVYEPTNSLILSDFGSNVERITGILKELDVKGFEEQLELITIKHAKAKDIAELMDQIINKGASKKNQGSGGFTSGIPRFGQTQKSGASDAFSLVIPDDRTNSIIVVGNRAGIEKIRELVTKLDRRVRPDEAGGVYVYYVKHGDAEKIATTLNGLATDAKKQQTATTTPGAPGAPPILPSEQTQPIFGGEVKITHSKETNSLIITASRQDYQVLMNLMGKIDIPRDQVYVEAVIMEMSASNGQDYGVNYFKFDPASKGVARTGFSSGNLTSLLNPGASGAILGFGSGETFDMALGDKTVKVTSTLGFINFLKSVGTVNILSTPQVLAMDNEEATIEVGDTVPVTLSNNTSATSASTTATREDVTIKLTIKPHLSRTDDTIRLEFDQLVKQIGNQVAAGELSKVALTTTKRNLKSQIVVRNGDTAVLGGLMKDVETENITKVPLLGDIPILGWLFKGKTTKKEKVNLLVFLTPYVLRTKTDADRVLSRKMADRVEYIRNNMGGRDPFGADAEKIQRKADLALSQAAKQPPAPPAKESTENEEDIPLEETATE